MKRHYLISLLWVSISYFILISILHAETPKANAMTKKCPTCNKIYSEDTKFCGDDGTQLVEIQVKLICPECKKEGIPGEKFCKEHGKKLIPLPEVPPTQESDTLKQKKELAKKYYK